MKLLLPLAVLLFSSCAALQSLDVSSMTGGRVSHNVDYMKVAIPILSFLLFCVVNNFSSRLSMAEIGGRERKGERSRYWRKA